MSTAGSGIGGSIGTPTQLSVHELEATASTEIAKAAMKIVSDTSEVCFFLLDPNVRKYQTSANRPVLAPLVNIRVSTPQDQPNTGALDALYAGLVDLLPSDFRQLFQEMQLLPKSQQVKEFIILDQNLRAAAWLLSWLLESALPIAEGSIISSRVSANILAPYLALTAVVQESEQFLSGMQSFLEAIGPNDPNFDPIASYLGAYAPLADDLKTALKWIQEPSSEKNGRALLQETSDKLAALGEQFDRLYSGGDLLMIGYTLHSSKTAARALSFEQPGSAALYLALSIASSGIRKDQSSLGFLGAHISAVYEQLTHGLTQISGSPSAAKNELFSHLTTLVLVATAMAGSLQYEATLPGKDASAPVLADRNFSYGLMTQMLVGSGFLSAISGILLQASEIKGEAAAVIKPVLTAALLLSLISASSKGQDLAASGPLLGVHIEALKQEISKAAEGVEKALGEGKLSGEVAQNLDVSLKQAKIALEGEDIDGLLAALAAAAELTGATGAGLVGDLNEVKSTASILQSGLRNAGNNQLGTEIHVAA